MAPAKLPKDIKNMGLIVMMMESGKILLEWKD